MEMQARKATALVPIRVEFETDTHRIRDCFVWNLNEDLIEPETFARTFCADLDLPENPWVETVATQIRAQLEEHEGLASMDLNIDTLELRPEDEIPECRVILSVRSLTTYPLTSTNRIYIYSSDRRANRDVPPAGPHRVGPPLTTHARDVRRNALRGPRALRRGRPARRARSARGAHQAQARRGRVGRRRCRPAPAPRAGRAARPQRARAGQGQDGARAGLGAHAARRPWAKAAKERVA